MVVPDEQLSLAIGRRGQNVRLASQLTGWDIDILTEDDESERRQQEWQRRSARFIEALDVDEVIAGLLVTEGFRSVDEVAYVPVAELAEIEGFSEEIAEELRSRARGFIEAEQERLTARCEELKIQEDLIDFDGLALSMVVRLGEAGVLSLDDFADLASDEFLEALGEEAPLSREEADQMIMTARIRAGWFSEEELAEIMAEDGNGAENGENEENEDGETAEEQM